MNEVTDARKLLLSYDMKPEAGQEYYQFVLGRYVPIMQTLGLEMAEAWHTAYGNGPDRMLVFVAQDVGTMEDLLENETWHALNSQLLKFVTDFRYKVVRYKQGFQL